jgi:predicted RNase H-like HicB family nuclease
MHRLLQISGHNECFPDGSAYVPDLPGCIAAGITVAETKERIRQAIELHLKGLREDGEVIPEPRTV